MEITKCHFAFFTIVLTFTWTETAGYRADRIRQELNHIREDISSLFEKTDQLNISVVENRCPCVSGNKSYPPVTKHNGRQDMVNVNNNKVLLKYRSLLEAFGSEKKINRELQHQLRSMGDNFLASEKVARDNTRNQQSQLQSMEASISAIKEVANKRYRELQSRLRSLEESIEDKIFNIYRDLRNDMMTFMTAVSNAETTSVKSDITTSPIINTNCKTVPESGVYTLHLELIMSPVNVYCNQEIDGGGWIVFMRRQDGSVNFTRPWADYKYGFGNLDGEFWAGNELLYELSKEKPVQLRIDMEDFDGNTAFAMYEEFRIGAETDKYRLYVSGYSGTAGDSLIDTRYSYTKLAGMQFSTYDSDNDKFSGGNCAKWVKSGWWYNACLDADLNKPYSYNKTLEVDKGIVWYSWKSAESLKRVEMKIR